MSQDTAAPEGTKPEDVKDGEAPKAPTVAEIIGEPKEDKPEPKMVPEAVFLEEKKARKALERDMKELQRRVEEGATKIEVSESIEEIAKEYDVDPKFLTKFAATIRKDAKAEAEKELGNRLKPLEEKERAEKIQKVFDTHFSKALGDMDEYKEIVNKDVIFALSLNPQNSSKTIPQLIEETYGSAVRGRRSMETTTPRGGAPAGEFDPDRANRDASYLKEVLKDPQLRKSYEAWKAKQGR
jgi:hypothetical protein